jgi:hypothetical protein
MLLGRHTEVMPQMFAPRLARIIFVLFSMSL